MKQPIPPLVDFSGLGKLAHNPVFVRELMQLFVAQVPTQVEQMQAAIAQQNWPELARHAHSLKSLFGTLRIEPGTTLLNQMQHQELKPQTPAQLQAAVQQVASAARQVLEQFTTTLNTVQ